MQPLEDPGLREKGGGVMGFNPPPHLKKWCHLNIYNILGSEKVSLDFLNFSYKILCLNWSCDM